MSKSILGIVIGAVVGAAVGAGGSYLLTKRYCKKKYEEDLSNQLTECRKYYKMKYKNFIKDTIEDKEFDSEDEAKEILDKPDEELVITDPTVKQTASEIAQEKAVIDYHKKFGEPTIDIFEEEDDDFDPLNPIPIQEGPHCIRRAEALDNPWGYDQVSIVMFTGDFKRLEDGEKLYLEILYSEGYTNDRVDENGDLFIEDPEKDPYYEKVITSANAAAILGTDWRKNIGDDSYDPDDKYPIGYDYDNDECFIINHSQKIIFHILRDDRMYKCIIKDCEPGDPFDYDEVM